MFIGFLALSAIIGGWILWRLASRRHTLPCPVWLRWFVELDNPFTKTTRANEIIAHLQLQPGMRVADIGCGPGRVTIPLAKTLGPTGFVLAVDSQSGMLNRAKQRAQTEQLSNIQFIQADAAKGIPFSEQFDRVILVTVLGEIPDRLAALKNIFNMLKLGGILSVSEIIFDPHYQTQQVVRQLTGQVGLQEKNYFGNKIAYTLHFVKV